MATEAQHRSEVTRGDRFEFGANWARFLKVLNEDRIRLAETSLKQMLQVERLDGRTFLDVGSGSGLFSLCARRLGARVHSFDYDPQSFACTQELRRRYFPNDTNWTVEQGSVLDTAYLGQLGTFDIVYSWGVLHHTGQMWPALDNVKPLVKMGGYLFIAIYNDLSEVTDRWAAVKKRYNGLPRSLALAYALSIIAREESKSIVGHARQRKLAQWHKTWTEYDKESTRGMSKWHDWIDWIGGHPYERATVEEIVDYYAKDGFALTNLVDRSYGYGCNEFVFRRTAPMGSLVDSPLPGGTSLVRQYGRRVVDPFELTSQGWVGKVANAPLPVAPAQLYLFSDGCLQGPATLIDGKSVMVAPASANESAVKAAKHFVVPGSIRKPEAAFQHLRGNMWAWEVPDLEALADDKTANKSPVYILENDEQLRLPHTIHDEIAKLGGGRFSHWSRWVCFAPVDNCDPNLSKNRFSLFIAQSSTKLG